MKNVISVTLLLAFACTSFAQDEKEKPFFDMENCAVCKSMSDMKSDMMKIKCETHIVDNGFLQISVIPDELKDKFGGCMKSMEQTLTKLKSGEKMELCGYCSSFGGLIAAGAKKNELDTVGGKIMLVTSDDPAVVKKIHAMANKVKEEHKKMMEMMKKDPSNQKG